MRTQYSSNGDVVVQQGLSVLVDNGYLKFKELQCPHKQWFDMETLEWSKTAESLRFVFILYCVRYTVY